MGVSMEVLAELHEEIVDEIAGSSGQRLTPEI
jgi:hypothetical protein